MNTTPDARARPTMGQETIQTVLLITVSLVGTWLGLYRVPWQVSGDPCLIAAAATVALFILLWLTRWRGLRGINFERNLLAAFQRGYAARLCAALPVRFHRTCDGLLALGRGLGSLRFCCSCHPWCEALAVVPCHRNRTPRINVGLMALPKLDLYARLVRSCLLCCGPRARSLRGSACSRV